MNRIILKINLLTLILFSTIGCSKSNDLSSSFSNYKKIVDHQWKVYEARNNGVNDPTIITQNQIFNFRSDGKVYFSQSNPSYKDTLAFSFTSNDNIKLTKPWISSTVIINLKVEKITEYDFDFTLLTNENSDIDQYKTTKL